MNNEFNELTIDKVKQIVQKAARPNNLHFTIDRSSAGQIMLNTLRIHFLLICIFKRFMTL